MSTIVALFPYISFVFKVKFFFRTTIADSSQKTPRSTESSQKDSK